MADDRQREILRRGARHWNEWREENEKEIPDLTGADLAGLDLAGVNLSGARLTGADLTGTGLAKADLTEAQLEGAKLAEAKLVGAYLTKANLTGGVDLTLARLSEADLTRASLNGATLPEADLSRASLYRADLSGCVLTGGANLTEAEMVRVVLDGADLEEADLFQADLSMAKARKAIFRDAVLAEAVLYRADLGGAVIDGADLSAASLVEANLQGASLDGCRIYGVSAWNVDVGEETSQADLVITHYKEPKITVDNLEVAQFVYLLLNNEKIRDVISTIGKKGVLILGRFSDRMHVLQAVRDELRRLEYLPIVFDFDLPEGRDFSETVLTLAGLSRFIVADITSPKSVPLELKLTVPEHMIPFIPIIESSEEPFSMLDDLLNKHDWVLRPLEYDSVDQLVGAVKAAIVGPAEERLAKLKRRKGRRVGTRKASDYT